MLKDTFDPTTWSNAEQQLLRELWRMPLKYLAERLCKSEYDCQKMGKHLQLPPRSGEISDYKRGPWTKEEYQAVIDGVRRGNTAACLAGLLRRSHHVVATYVTRVRVCIKDGAPDSEIIARLGGGTWTPERTALLQKMMPQSPSLDQLLVEINKLPGTPILSKQSICRQARGLGLMRPGREPLPSLPLNQEDVAVRVLPSSTRDGFPSVLQDEQRQVVHDLGGVDVPLADALLWGWRNRVHPSPASVKECLRRINDARRTVGLPVFRVPAAELNKL